MLFIFSVFKFIIYVKENLNIIFVNGFVVVILLIVVLLIEFSVVYYIFLFLDILKIVLNCLCFGGGVKIILFDFMSINVKILEWSGIWFVIMIK